MAIYFSNAQIGLIRRHGAACYPNECCGFLLGTTLGNDRIVRAVRPVSNEFDEAQQARRYLIEPKDVWEMEQDARSAGVDILGVYHSHPDHPAHPSEYDRTHAWPSFSYLIVSIVNGRPREVFSWLLSEDREEFNEERITVQESPAYAGRDRAKWR
jgi:proteasome lid subunit RPN8/RPN11